MVAISQHSALYTFGNALVLQTVEETSGEVRKPVLDFHALLVLFFEMCSTTMMNLI